METNNSYEEYQYLYNTIKSKITWGKFPFEHISDGIKTDCNGAVIIEPSYNGINVCCYGGRSIYLNDLYFTDYNKWFFLQKEKELLELKKFVGEITK